MKKFNIIDILANDTDTPRFDYGISFTDEDNNTVEIINGGDFCNMILQKYFCYWLLTPGYYNTNDNQYYDFCNDVFDAVDYLHMIYANWVDDRLPGFIKLYEAYNKDYDPLNGYDKYIHSTFESKGSETEEMTPSGTEKSETSYEGTKTDELSYSGKETTTETPSGTEKEETTKSGTEKTTHDNGNTGHITTLARTPYDSATMYDAEKTTESPYTDSDETSFTNRKDSVEKSFTNRKTTTELEYGNTRKDTNTTSFLNRKDTIEKSFTNRKDTKTKSFLNRVNEYDLHEYGDGGNTPQEMIESQFVLANKIRLRDYIVNLFVHENLVM